MDTFLGLRGVELLNLFIGYYDAVSGEVVLRDEIVVLFVGENSGLVERDNQVWVS